MTKKTSFDSDAAHKHFSVACFNEAWDLIEKTNRTAEEDEQMIRLSMASHWHWTQRDDCSATNVSIAYWQLSRIYAILGRVNNARRYGQLCLEASQIDGVGLFFLAYAYEALARAEAVAGNRVKMKEYLRKGHEASDAVTGTDERKMILDDLAVINC